MDHNEKKSNFGSFLASLQKPMSSNPFLNMKRESVQYGYLDANSIIIGRELSEFGGYGYPYCHPILFTGIAREIYFFDIAARHIASGGSVIVFANTSIYNEIELELRVRVHVLSKNPPIPLPVTVFDGEFTEEEIISLRNDAKDVFKADGVDGVPLTVVIDHHNERLQRMFFLDETGEKPEPLLFVDKTLTECPAGVAVDLGPFVMKLTVRGLEGDPISYEIDEDSKLVTILGLENETSGYADGKVARYLLSKCTPEREYLDDRLPALSALKTLEDGVRACKHPYKILAFAGLIASGSWKRIKVPGYGVEEGYISGVPKRNIWGLSMMTGLSPNGSPSELDTALQELYSTCLANVVVPGSQDHPTYHGIPFRRVPESDAPAPMETFKRKKSALCGFFDKMQTEPLCIGERTMFIILVTESVYDPHSNELVVDLNKARANYSWLPEKHWLRLKENIRKRHLINRTSENVYQILPPAQVPWGEKKRIREEEERRRAERKAKKEKTELNPVTSIYDYNDSRIPFGF